jgi:hypothetical protein
MGQWAIIQFFTVKGFCARAIATELELEKKANEFA